MTLYILFSAILEMLDPVDFIEDPVNDISIKPLCLPSWANKQYSNDRGLIAGWGWDPFARIWATDLKAVNTVIWTNRFGKYVMEQRAKHEQTAITKYTTYSLF